MWVFNTHNCELPVDILTSVPGLYEAILQTSGDELLETLKAITLFLEKCRGTEINVAVHCVQGKDR